MTLFDQIDGEPGPGRAFAVSSAWRDVDREERRRRRMPAWLIAALAHLAAGALFLISLPHADPPPDTVDIVLVPPPARPAVEPPKPEARQTPEPQQAHPHAIPRPVPRLDPPSPLAIAVPTLPQPPALPSREPAPAVSAPSAPSAAPPQTYLDALYAHLAQYKHYPRALLLAHIQGTPLLRFTFDHHGRVLAHRIERGSGHAELDAEAEAMIERAQPLPAPPADMPDPVEMVIPIQFTLH